MKRNGAALPNIKQRPILIGTGQCCVVLRIQSDIGWFVVGVVRFCGQPALNGRVRQQRDRGGLATGGLYRAQSRTGGGLQG